METSKNPREEINILDYLIIVLKNKDFIIKTTLAAMFIAAVVSLIIPPVYLAETKILPPQSASSSMATAFAAQMGSLGRQMPGLNMKTINDLYVSLLKTKPVLDYVLDKMGLMEKRRTKSRELARKRLRDSLTVTDDKQSGIITVCFYDRSPQMAADIANTFIEGLQNLNNNLAVTEASQRRLFFDEQLKSAKESLIRSEEAMKSFQQRTGTVKIDDQAKGTIEETALIRAKISGKEVQLRIMKSYATPLNPDMQRLEDEIFALKEQLSKLESTAAGDDTTLSTGKISVLGIEYLRKMREFKYSEALYEILLKQYELAKLDESRDASIVQVVARAEAPETRTKPQRRRIVINTGVIFFVLSIFFVLLRSSSRSLVAELENRAGRDSLREFGDFNRLAADLRLLGILDKVRGFWQYKRRNALPRG